MPYLFVSSLEYGELFCRLLAKRLRAAGEEHLESENGLLVKGTPAAAGAISDAIVRDLKPLELARLVSLLPVSLREKREILPRAMELTKNDKQLDFAREAVQEYISWENLLIAEGFLRFRLPEVLEDWALAVDKAGEELLLRREFAELTGIFCAFSTMLDAENLDGELTLILHRDGSFVLNGGNGIRVESERTDKESIIELLESFDPKRLTVYDLTEGAGRSVTKGIKKRFGNKAEIFML